MLSQPWNEDALTGEVPGLRRYARRLVGGDADRADDLVQECILRAMTRGHRFQPDSNLRAWLTTMLRNLYIDDQRRNDRSATALNANALLSPQGSAPNQEWAVALQETRRCIGKLPARDQEIIDMMGVAGFSTREAAERLQIPVGTIKSRLSRARRRLPKMMEEAGS